MYSIIFQDHIDGIKRVTGIVGAAMSLIAFISNFIVHKIEFQITLNLILLGILTLLFLLSIFSQGIWTRYIQVFIFISMGITTILFSNIHFLGDIIFISGILYLYIYRIIKEVKKYIFLIFIGSIIVIRILTGFLVVRESIFFETLASVFTVTILSLLIYIFQYQLAWYTRQSYKNEQLLRIGMNAHNLIHEQNLNVHTETIEATIDSIRDGDYETAITYLEATGRMIDKHNRQRRLLLENYTRTNGLNTSVFELNELIEFLLQFEYLNHSPEFYLSPRPEYTNEDIAIKGNRYEISSLFQILIDNAVEAMRKTGTAQHKLYVNFEIKKKLLLSL